MTRNVKDWLGFPISALQKGVSVEQIFENILDDDEEDGPNGSYKAGKKIDFNMNSFRNAVENEDNNSEGEFESTLCMKDKKCKAGVWLKPHDYALAPPSYLDQQK